jgi:hypothetical protein
MPLSLPPNASRERVRLCPGLCAPGLDARGDPGIWGDAPASSAAGRLEGPGGVAAWSTSAGSRGAGEPVLDLDFSDTPVSLLNQPIPRTALLTQLLSDEPGSAGAGGCRWVTLPLAMLTRGVRRALMMRHRSTACPGFESAGRGRRVVLTRSGENLRLNEDSRRNARENELLTNNE